MPRHPQLIRPLRLIPALCVLLALPLCLAAPAAAQDGDQDVPTRPTWQNLRWQEDWSAWRDAPESAYERPWDRLKAIKLTDDGDVWLSMGGQWRNRLETWNNFGFSDREPLRDDTFWLNRIRLHADLHVGEHVRAFVEGKSAFSTDRDLPGGRRGLDADSIDLQNAWLQLQHRTDDGFWIFGRAGRQELQFGRQRLVSPLNWSNTRRTWDGGRLDFGMDNWSVSAWYVEFAPVDKYDFNQHDDELGFAGTWFTLKDPSVDRGIDLYWLWNERSGVVKERVIGREERNTFGARGWLPLFDTGIEWETEAAYQLGDHEQSDVDAWMIATVLSRPFPDVAWKPTVSAGFDFASGDDRVGDGELETFDQIYPLGHAYFGAIDAVGRQNLISLNGAVVVRPLDRLTVKTQAHWFWRDEENDAMYNAGAGVVRAGGPGTDRSIGSELDIIATWKFNRHWVGQLGYAHFFAGEFLDDTGTADDVDFFYAQLQFTW